MVSDDREASGSVAPPLSLTLSKHRVSRVFLALATSAALSLSCRHHPGSHRGDLLRATFLSARDGAFDARRNALMASSPVSFYRATLSLFRRDWIHNTAGLSRSRFAVAGPMPLGVGDPHVENFGTLLGRDGRVTFEPDDLDAAARLPYLWDLRRLIVGLCVAARDSNANSPTARRAAASAATAIARETARAYAEAICERAHDAPSADGAIVDDLTRRAASDAASREELSELTVITDGARRLKRGPVDPRDASEQLLAPSRPAIDALPELFERYRQTLRTPPDGRFFTPLDVARATGRGAASSATARLLVLLRGPSDAPEDDVIVEIKELPEAVTPDASLDVDPVARVLAAREVLWSRPDADPYWGAATWRGCPVQLRAETAAAKGIHVARMRGRLGTPEALTELARTLARRLAAIHLRSLPRPPPQAEGIARDVAGFVEEQAQRSTRYADLVFEDWARFRRIVQSERPAATSASGPSSRPACSLFEAP